MHYLKHHLLAVLAVLLQPALAEAQAVFSSSGTDPASIQATVDAYRAALGTINPNVVGSFGTGRREINWDGVPDALAAPNFLPANFFNVNSPRGVVFSTPGTGFSVSANSVNPSGTPIQFGNIDPTYPSFLNPSALSDFSLRTVRVLWMSGSLCRACRMQPLLAASARYLATSISRQ